jgi:hypothetical protein
VEPTSSEHVLIAVKLHRESQQLYSSREISFQPEDAQAERARSIGLSLGVLANTLLAEQETQAASGGNASRETLVAVEAETKTGAPPPADAENETSSEAREPAPPEKSEPVETRQDPPRHDPARFFLGISAGVDLNPTWRSIGPSADLSIGLLPLPSLVLQGRFSAAHHRGQGERPALVQLSPSVGAGWYFDFQSLGLLPLLEGGAEHIIASIEDSDATGAIPRLSHWSGFVRASSALLVPIGKGFSFSATPSMILSFSPTEPKVDGVSQGSSGNLRFSARGGIIWMH